MHVLVGFLGMLVGGGVAHGSLRAAARADAAAAHAAGAAGGGNIFAELSGGAGKLAFQLDGRAVALQLGTHLFLSSTDALKAGAL